MCMSVSGVGECVSAGGVQKWMSGGVHKCVSGGGGVCLVVVLVFMCVCSHVCV